MSIIIPSKKIYELENKLVISNNYSGVNFNVKTFEYSEEFKRTQTLSAYSTAGLVDDVVVYSDSINLANGNKRRYRYSFSFRSIRYGVSENPKPLTYESIGVTYESPYYKSWTGNSYNYASGSGINLPTANYVFYVPPYSEGRTACRDYIASQTIKCFYQVNDRTETSFNFTLDYIDRISVYEQEYNGSDVVSSNRIAYTNSYSPTTTTDFCTLTISSQVIKTEQQNYGNSIENYLTFDENDLITDETRYKTQRFYPSNLIYSDAPLAKMNYSLLVRKSYVGYQYWINGKETAKILCSIGEYYDELGQLVVSTKNGTKMCFDIGDCVIPKLHSSNGEKPLSNYSDGTPKIFKVTGIRFLNDGAVWQELDLLEEAQVS